MPLAVDFQGGLTSAWSNVITFVPKLAAALLIILVGYLIAKVVANVLNKVLERVGFDRAVERGGLKQALARSKYDPSDIIAKLAFWLIFLVSLQIAFGVFGPNPISDLLQGLIAYLPNVFVAIVIIVVAAAIAKAATDLLSNLLSSVSGGQVMAKGAGIAVLVFGAFAALDQLQIAPRIVTGLWYAILAIVVGSAVVASRWRRDQDHAALLGAGHQQGRGARPRAQAAGPAVRLRRGERSGGLRRHRDPGVRGRAAQPATPRPLGRPDGGTPRQDTGPRRPVRQPTTPSHTPQKGSCMPPSIDTVQSWQGRTMVDPAGDKLGTIDAIYLDDETGQPEWATVTRGLFTAKAAFVPLAQAQDIGDSVQVPYDKQQVTDAPSMEADGELSQDEEAELYRHYGLDYSEHRSDSGLAAGTDRDADGDTDHGTVGRDTSGPTTDDAMTRSEEELRVGTRPASAAGRGCAST